MISAVAGTFNVIHDGHKAMIDRAFEIGDSVIIGITSDRMASEGRDECVPYYLREKALRDLVKNYSKPCSFCMIEDIYGPAEMDVIDVLVVSDETYGNGMKVVQDHKERGVGDLRLELVPLVMCKDGSEKISASSILKGEYSRKGERDVITIGVGSANRVKVEAVRTVMEKVFGDVVVRAYNVSSGVPDQPFEEQTRQGAVNRANSALKENMLGVGIEAGVFETVDGLYDYQYCAIVDKDGFLTVGTGMGFRYPDAVSDLVRKGSTVGDAVHAIYGNRDIGKSQGAIGLLSMGLIDRKSLTEQSITAAMVPRLSGL